MKMNQEAKALWLANLRDPSAKQIKGQLGDANGGRCCLGVLCDIAVNQGIVSLPRRDSNGLLWYEETKVSLPVVVQDWAGVRSHGQGRMGRQLPLAELNDDGKTFAEIADVIEEEF